MIRLFIKQQIIFVLKKKTKTTVTICFVYKNKICFIKYKKKKTNHKKFVLNVFSLLTIYHNIPHYTTTGKQKTTKVQQN